MGTKPASFLLRRAILPHLQHHFSLFPTPFYLIPHAVLPYPPHHFALSPTPFLPYPPRHFALSPTPFCLIPHVVSPYPQSHLFTFSSFHLFTFSPFHPLFNHRKHTCFTHPCPSLTNFYAADAMMLHAHWPSIAVPFIQNNHLKISTLSNHLKKNSTREEW